ncbi:hypothetical protein FPV13_13795 (plasmid) [Mammaliicoccus sciuri]|uniref:hypothetical protein n=1 Tax=Mammaliicoccus sciuri TaxID=1296 RepID=UPI00118782E6|nr:hypothetical protein [Mammaliicoccus sciuri]QDR65973.1 hypothetical protein FPV13_13795 [Mammaliicoccus sciuri]
MSKQIENKELEIITTRAKNVGYKILSYSNLLDELKEDTDYMDEEIEVFVFEAGEEYKIIESRIIVTDFKSVAQLEAEVLNNVKKTKSYKRSTAWGKKLYDYAKLNNFAFTFVLGIDG